MRKKTFSIIDSVAEGFDLFFGNFFTFFSAYLASILLWYVGAILTRMYIRLGILFLPDFQSYETYVMVTKFLQFVLTLPLVFLVTGLLLGIKQITFDIAYDGKSRFSRLFSCFHLVHKSWLTLIATVFLISSLFVGCNVFAFFSLGFFVSIKDIPPLSTVLFFPLMTFLMVKVMFSNEFIVDKKIGPSSLIESFKLTRGNWWRTFGLAFVSQLAVLTVLGLFVLPMIWTVAYCNLREE